MRYLVEVQGDRVGRTSLHLEVPEKWRRDYQTLRSKNLAAGKRRDVRPHPHVRRGPRRLPPARAAQGREVEAGRSPSRRVGAALQLLASLNELPIRLFDYDTAEAWSGFLATALLAGRRGRRRARGRPLPPRRGGRAALPRDVSRPARARADPVPGARFRSKRFFRGLLLGYAMTAFFFAYQVVFYIAAERLGRVGAGRRPVLEPPRNVVPVARRSRHGLHARDDRGVLVADVLDPVRAPVRAGLGRGDPARIRLGLRALHVPEPALLHPRARGGVRGRPDRPRLPQGRACSRSSSGTSRWTPSTRRSSSCARRTPTS